MRRLAVSIAVSALLVSSVLAGTLSEAEVASLRSEVASITASFERGDVEQIIARTHASLYELSGGREAFAAATRQSVELLRQTGVKFLQVEVGAPTQTYSAGADEVCFVPKISIMEVQAQKMKSTTFMIAIRQRGSVEWKYLDGAGLRKHPEVLYRLLPNLERGIALPPNFIEVL